MGKTGNFHTLAPKTVTDSAVINADGSGLKLLMSRTDFTTVGSPDWSRDGRRIAFDGWKSLYGESFPQVRVLVAGADVQTSVASTGCSLPLTRRPELMST